MAGVPFKHLQGTTISTRKEVGEELERWTTVLKEKILRGVKAWLHDVPTGMGSLAMGPQYLKAACTLGVGPKQKAIKFPNPIMSLENGNIFSFYSTVGFPDSGTTS